MQLNEAPPEGTETVLAEGEDVRGALTKAASEFGIEDLNALGWELDKSWYRTEDGRVIARDSVRMVVWKRDVEEDVEEAVEEAEVVGDTKKWLDTLLSGMEVEAKVRVQLRDGRVRIGIDSEEGARLVGRRGRTLQAIEHLLLQSVGADHPEHSFSLDVADNRRRDDDRGDRRDRDDRGDRRDRDDRGRGRGRDRDDRGRGRDRDDRGGRGDRRGGRDDERNQRKLRQMTEKIGKRVLETGKSEVIRKELNSFDRRVVHVAASELEGIGTRSIGDGNLKQIEIYREGGASGEE